VPNCDFYAIHADALVVLEFVLEKTACEIYESYSEPGVNLRRFSTVDELAASFRGGASGPSLLLMLYAPEMRGEVSTRRIDLDKDKFPDEPWRSSVEGWGLIQLHLRGRHQDKLFASHTNHNSEKRALAWQSTHPEIAEPALWNWPEVTRISRRINRFIHQLASYKSGSRPVLPGAAACVESGEAALTLN
jgi:hypothetical protein